jgi:hypothetical protein
MGARPKMPIIMAMRMMMPEKIFSILQLVKNNLTQPENLVKKKIKPTKLIGSFFEKLHRMARKGNARQRPTA